jgi:NAD(P)-dependent dehydrogenase (short-subunit alcohol dehydrogenase family)
MNHPNPSRTLVALVTGASRGIGKAIAVQLAARGVKVVLHYRDRQAAAEAVLAALPGSGHVAIAADFAETGAAATLWREAAAAMGGVDILVNNAGVFPGGATHEISEAALDEVLAVNVKAAFLLVAAAAPRMAARGSGAIINVTTMAAEFGMPGLSAYGASKAAVVLLTKAWAAEYGPSGVRVNAVSPGPTHTAGTDAMGDAFNAIVATIPMGRAAQPAEIAQTIVFLASNRASYTNGAIIATDGGRTAV